MKKVVFFVVAAVIGYLGFLKISERRGIQSIWQQATDDVESSK
ncbi:hypothetical protein [Arcanobacterium hippocoleae]|uniref:Uncharacterized protein n=1 Tax=Arcanobacterium hippocoleae TaxID=149017 RepID=A0ABU1T2F0_9ACTO|nr:hypothetical protein [Arcanobacterium hippocoleae]MDR6939567.1 hypothetical protein [Arcanobacterium hippocoleae]